MHLLLFGALYSTCVSFSEAFPEKLADGQLSPETLAQVVSLQEEDHQNSLEPEVSGHLGLHLDSTLTI